MLKTANAIQAADALAKFAKKQNEVSDAELTATDIASILGLADDSAIIMSTIRQLTLEGYLERKANYQADDGDVYEFGSDAYDAAYLADGFRHPVTGKWVDGVVMLSPFWTITARAKGQVHKPVSIAEMAA